jgi:hypothetical protein
VTILDALLLNLSGSEKSSSAPSPPQDFEQISSCLSDVLISGVKPCRQATNSSSEPFPSPQPAISRYRRQRSTATRVGRADAKPHRKKLGRPKKPWHLPVSYQRRRNDKRLRRWQVEELIEADVFARRHSLSLVTFGTIRWGRTKRGEEDVPARWTAFWKGLGSWAKREGIELAYLYTHENPERVDGGLNSHFLTSVPAALRPAFDKRAGQLLDGNEGSVLIEARCQPRRADTRLRYMLKGTDRPTAIKYRLIEPQKGWDYAQGLISHKRAGTSANIGKAARASCSRDARNSQSVSQSVP